jgi:hypothetical protein
MKKSLTKILILFSTALFLGCGSQSTPPPAPSPSPAPPSLESPSLVGYYDSMDTAIVEAVDTENGTVTFINFALGKSYTLNYVGTTVISDKYDQALSIVQIQAGDIVDLCFMKDNKELVSMKLSPEAFVYRNVVKYSLNSQRHSASVGDENYRLSNSALILSEGQRIDASDIINRDIVTIRGIDRDVLSVIVDKGHGYLRLENDAYAIGGWIEVGQSIIQRVTDGMLLVVPEGTVEVYISHRGFSASQRVTIERNKETVLDLGEEEVEEIRKGKVIFTVTPADAHVYVDGDEVDTNSVVELEFGLHQVICEADGYDTVTQYIKVTQDLASITITMDKAGTNTGSGDDVSGNSLTPTGTARVYVDFPAGVELYVDGVYMGLTPAYFAKRSGSHTITLRLQGFITKSYTVYLDDDPTDVTYSFSALEPDLGNNGGVSGNEIGGGGNNTDDGGDNGGVSGNESGGG